MVLGQKGRDLIKSFEQLRLKAYRNFAGEPWTIGWGHTGKDVTESSVCTSDHADLWFECDIARPERAVNLMVKAYISQNEFDALVSFAYNVGIGAEAHSTLMRLFNSNDFEGAANEFLKWDHDNGVVVPGLARRRAAERALFLSTEVT